MSKLKIIKTSKGQLGTLRRNRYSNIVIFTEILKNDGCEYTPLHKPYRTGPIKYIAKMCRTGFEVIKEV